MNDIITLLLVAGIMLLFFGILGWISDLIADKLGWEEEGKRKSPLRTGTPKQGCMRKYPR